jgi:membrane fusion protein, multidrug efflux system
MSKRTGVVAAIVFVSLAGGGAYLYQQRQVAAAGAAKSASTPPRPTPVTIAAVEQKDVPLRFNVVGRTEALSTVTLKARIDGLITAVQYSPGQRIRKGQPMVTLDARALQAQLQQSEANLARDRAQLDKAKADLVRNQDLLAKGFISSATLDGFRATVDTLEATVKADIAAIELAKVQLSYTVITSPMDGVAGAVLAFPGGSVKASDTSLVVINQLRPIYATFAVPENQLAEIGRDRAAGKLKVEAKAPGNVGPTYVGELVFIDNTVDSTTGTIQMKAKFDNANEALTPGQFLEISMTLRNIEGAIIMPAEALQAGPNGSFVYVAKPDQTVEIRRVKVLPASKDKLIVETGLNPGDKVVTDGQLRLIPGAKYEAREPRGPGADKGGKGAPRGDGSKGGPASGAAPRADAPGAAAAPPAKNETAPPAANKGDAK